ncbi:MAG: guanylate kinase [Bryobacteraceae bacterium]|nr:guanylate kinase [Bryobacteraceae bacterium]MDW8377444.1 guanylate kinase [Bryobacterales bacterium]
MATRTPTSPEPPGAAQPKPLPPRRKSAVFIISAPSGSGKSTLVNRLLSSDPQLLFSISYTTRAPRGNERPGDSYFYISREEFEQRIARGEFLEWAEVFGNYYGTHQSVWERACREGKDLLLDIDVQGAAQLKQKIQDAVSIFVLAPSREILESRLRSRSEDSEEVILKRLAEAAVEIRNYHRYDYIVVNDDVEEAAATLLAIVRAERVRRERMEPRIRPILETFGEIL